MAYCAHQITADIQAGLDATAQGNGYDSIAAGECYSFRHDELLLFIARGLAARLDALESA